MSFCNLSLNLNSRRFPFCCSSSSFWLTMFFFLCLRVWLCFEKEDVSFETDIDSIFATGFYYSLTRLMNGDAVHKICLAFCCCRHLDYSSTSKCCNFRTDEKQLSSNDLTKLTWNTAEFDHHFVILVSNRFAAVSYWKLYGTCLCNITYLQIVSLFWEEAVNVICWWTDVFFGECLRE